MKGIEVGYVVQEGLDAAHRARAIFLEARDRLFGAGQAALGPRRAGGVVAHPGILPRHLLKGDADGRPLRTYQ